MIATLGSGISRHTFALGSRYVLKVPRLDGWVPFLNGLLGNVHEAERHDPSWPELCPVVVALPGGLALVARRAAPCDDSAATRAEIEALCERAAESGRLVATLAELKPSSWGWLDGRLVAVDYG